MNMAAILSLNTLLDAAAAVSVVAWLLRITLLATVACMYLALARRAHPALRHAVAVGSLLAVVLLPVASKLLPTVSVPVLRAPLVATNAPAATDPVPVIIDVPSSDKATAPPTLGAIDAAAAGPSAAHPARVTSPGSRSRILHFVRDGFASFRNWTRFAVVIWLMVAAVMLTRLLLAFGRARQISNHALLITDEFLRVEVERAGRTLGVTRWIDIAASGEIAVPMVIGVANPRIVLPVTAVHWSTERLGVVLLHEIAHIRRRDAVWMLFAQLVSALLWFHPLVVMLSRQVRRESERACDDLVLGAGVRGSDYAEHLVSIARLSVRRDPLASSALAFAARSTLERRVASILSGRARVMRARVIGAVVGVSLAIFGVTAAVHPTECASTTVSGQNNRFQLTQKQQDRIQQKIQTRLQNQIQHGIQYQFAGNDDRDDNDGEAWYDRATEYYQKGRYDKAARAYENAARFGHNRATAYYNAGCSYALSNQPGEAITALESALDEGFEDLDMYSSDEDLNSLRDDPRFKKLMDKVMHSDEGEQRRRAATRDYDRLAARKDVEDGEWSDVGIDLMRSGDYDRAALAFDNEFKLSHNTDEDALYNKACARALDGKTDEALKLLEQSMATGNVDADHMKEDSDLRSLHKDKRFDGLVDLARDLELNYPGFGESWSVNGKKVWKDAHFEDDEKHWAKSLPHFQEVANDHPKIGRAWFNLGYAQLKSGDAKSCTPNFQKALDLGYKPPTMMYNLACSTAQEGKIDAAFVWLDKSEKAGFEVWNSARWDDDLDPLRADPRWTELKKRWKDEERKRAEAHGVHIEMD
jgi:beta-lactamase regulating signal transducer with metallopeptidase domain/Flp pilus assembly protein TadD